MAWACSCLSWGKTILRRRLIIQTIGPFWDGNEVWLLTAGGAIFAAFPELVCHPVQWLLSGPAVDAGRADPACSGLRVSQ